MTLFNLSLLVSSFATNYATLFAMRVLLGAGAAIFLPAVLSLIVDYFPPGHQTKALACLSVG